MLTVKVFRGNNQVSLHECEEVFFDKHPDYPTIKTRVILDTVDRQLGLDGSETVYVENESGKTIHVIRPENSNVTPMRAG